ncbi:MAG TPA: hypothetical protein VFB58_12445 [Chloroflexota bacterium]|nr:hypothetical protein [Chloroflexota bacterium]
MRRMPSGSSVAVNRMFRDHPLATPLGLALVGIALVGLYFFVMDAASTHAGIHVGVLSSSLMLGLGMVMLLVGALTLPIGLVTVARRRANPVRLHCPACGYQSGASSSRFRVQRLGGLEYSSVTCPQCTWQFTVDKYAHLH